MCQKLVTDTDLVSPQTMQIRADTQIQFDHLQITVSVSQSSQLSDLPAV